MEDGMGIWQTHQKFLKVPRRKKERKNAKKEDEPAKKLEFRSSGLLGTQ